MNIAITKADCCGCHACAIRCPKQCITMQRDAEGFFYPRIDEAACIKCGLCETVCPVLNAVPADENAKPMAFAAINPEEQVRMESSSGGVFSALAGQVLARGGIVFGAAWSEDFREVRHIGVESVAELAKLRGSKYVQSTMGDCYAQVRSALRQGRPVLFSGTPCQAEGLRTFLGKDDDNLLLVDIVCHGVPAPAVWNRYLDECGERAGAAVENVQFRNKESGWQGYKVKFTFANGKQQALPGSEDPFMNAFIRNACLRPSCHDCRFKKLNRVSDLTLADFWGIEDVCPEMDDNRGTSLVLAHSEKGQKALSELNLNLHQVDVLSALAQNPCAVKVSPVHPNREAFLLALDSMPFKEAVKTHLPRKVSPKEWLGNVLEKLGLIRIVRKILGKK